MSQEVEIKQEKEQDPPKKKGKDKKDEQEEKPQKKENEDQSRANEHLHKLNFEWAKQLIPAPADARKINQTEFISTLPFSKKSSCQVLIGEYVKFLFQRHMDDDLFIDNVAKDEICDVLGCLFALYRGTFEDKQKQSTELFAFHLICFLFHQQYSFH